MAADFFGAKSITISTGNSEIDKKMGGGIPSGSLVLIAGESDSGKSVLTQQLMWGSVKGGCRVTILSTENTVRSLISQMQSLSLDILDYALLGHLKIYPVKATRAQNAAGGGLETLLDAVKKLHGTDLVVIDSLTSFIARATAEDTVSFFEECKALCGEGITIAIVAHPYAFSESTLVRISSMCDARLNLASENVGEKLMKVLEVRKIRGAEKTTGNIVTFEVEPGWGMRIIPFTKARA